MAKSEMYGQSHLIEQTIQSVRKSLVFFFGTLLFSFFGQVHAFTLSENVEISGGLTFVTQRANKILDGSRRQDQNTRGDLVLMFTPTARHSFLAHLRMSNGNGIDAGSNSSVNAVVPGDEHDFDKPVLLQGFYRFASDNNFDLTLGQMDPYAFFDANRYADDETSTFMNLAFIHNPLLDIGGDLNPGTYGGTPGAHMHKNFKLNDHSISLSVGVFGSGYGADLKGSVKNRVTLFQVEWGHSEETDKRGHYRLYYWDRNKGTDIDGVTEMPRAAGVGISLDQSVTEHIGVFSRYGKSLDNLTEEGIDNALTIGLSISGAPWGRGDDQLGLALGKVNMYVDNDEDLSEIFYRVNVSEYLSVTPSSQRIEFSNGSSVEVFSLRLSLAF
jgi:high affinity Mn2+ porin